MTSARQPKLKTSLQIWAVVSLVAWILASTVCSTESLFGHSHEGDEHSHGHSAEQNHHQDGTAPDETSGHSQDNGNKGDSCCSTLQTVPPSTSSLVFLKPDFGKLFPLHVILLTQVLEFTEPEVSPPRQAKHREWVFTPEVCLGPAFRAHAPPLFA